MFITRLKILAELITLADIQGSSALSLLEKYELD